MSRFRVFLRHPWLNANHGTIFCFTFCSATYPKASWHNPVYNYGLCTCAHCSGGRSRSLVAGSTARVAAPSTARRRASKARAQLFSEADDPGYVGLALWCALLLPVPLPNCECLYICGLSKTLITFSGYIIIKILDPRNLEPLQRPQWGGGMAAFVHEWKESCTAGDGD